MSLTFLRSNLPDEDNGWVDKIDTATLFVVVSKMTCNQLWNFIFSNIWMFASNNNGGRNIGANTEIFSSFGILLKKIFNFTWCDHIASIPQNILSSFRKIQNPIKISKKNFTTDLIQISPSSLGPQRWPFSSIIFRLNPGTMRPTLPTLPHPLKAIVTGPSSSLVPYAIQQLLLSFLKYLENIMNNNMLNDKLKSHLPRHQPIFYYTPATSHVLI